MKAGWIFCDSAKVGSLKQAEALADKLEINVMQTFDVRLNLPWRYLPPQAGLFHINPLPHQINRPYPDVVIGIGRQSVVPTLYMRHFSKTIFIQNPAINPKYFNCVIAPQHDNLSAPNAINITGSLHKISPEYIGSLPASKFQSTKPMIAIFIGGNSKHVTYTDDMMHAMCATFTELANQGYDLLITPLAPNTKRTCKYHSKFTRQDSPSYLGPKIRQSLPRLFKSSIQLYCNDRFYQHDV
jgi:mitochondrial fission protein ELM1